MKLVRINESQAVNPANICVVEDDGINTVVKLVNGENAYSRKTLNKMIEEINQSLRAEPRTYNIDVAEIRELMERIEKLIRDLGSKLPKDLEGVPASILSDAANLQLAVAAVLQELPKERK